MCKAGLGIIAELAEEPHLRDGAQHIAALEDVVEGFIRLLKEQPVEEGQRAAGERDRAEEGGADLDKQAVILLHHQPPHAVQDQQSGKAGTQQHDAVAPPGLQAQNLQFRISDGLSHGGFPPQSKDTLKFFLCSSIS